MPFSYEICKDDDCITVQASGEVSTADGIALIRALVGDPAYRRDYAVLCDLRDCEPELPELADIEQLAGALEAVDHGHRARVAVVATPGEIFELARLACEYAAQSGLEIHLFDAWATAQTWLEPASTMD